MTPEQIERYQQYAAWAAELQRDPRITDLSVLMAECLDEIERLRSALIDIQHEAKEGVLSRRAFFNMASNALEGKKVYS